MFADKSARILDIGAGTGFVGQYLKRFRFNNVDALEPAGTMLEVARQKDAYKNLYQEGIYCDRPTSLDSGTYLIVENIYKSLKTKNSNY